MTVAATRDVASITRVTRDTDARELALAAYDLLLAELAALAPEDWGRPVPDCPDWTVADLVGHLVGAAKGHASPPRLLRQLAVGRLRRGRFDGNDTDAMNDLQVRDHARLTSDQRLAALRRVAPRAVAGRMRAPTLLRRVRIPIAQSGSFGPGTPKGVSMAHLLDTVLTRDVWLHRFDVARATGTPIVADAPVDARVVEDVVAEWATRHGQPFELALTGPAGGRFRQGTGGPTLELDAVELCRVLSGRSPGEGLLATRVLF